MGEDWLGWLLPEESVRTAALTSLPFLQAAESWLESRRPYISPKTFHEYLVNIRTLSAFFEPMRLSDISPDQVRVYQRMRLAKCGPHSINHETGVLQQMLKRVGRWGEFIGQYQPLPLPKGMRGQILSDGHRVRLFECAKERSGWMAVYTAALISINTTASVGEILTLQLKDIDLQLAEIRINVEGSKNAYRHRPAALNEDAMAAILLALDRAKDLGATEPHHYLYPFRARKGKHDTRENYDPTRHQTTLKTAWLALKRKAELPRNFRFEDLRHTAYTTLLQDSRIPPEVADSMAGHKPGSKARRFYSHIQRDAMRRASEALMGRKARKAVRSVRPSENREDNEGEIAKQLVGLLSKLLKQQG